MSEKYGIHDFLEPRAFCIHLIPGTCLVLLLAIIYPLLAEQWGQTISISPFYFQATFIPQYHFDFNAPYSGDNSLLPSEPIRASVSGTAFLSYKPFRNTYYVFNPEAAGGKA